MSYNPIERLLAKMEEDGSPIPPTFQHINCKEAGEDETRDLFDSSSSQEIKQEVVGDSWNTVFDSASIRSENLHPTKFAIFPSEISVELRKSTLEMYHELFC